MILLLDIEGTTTPISFVYEVLFPFARVEMQGYVEGHWSELAEIAAGYAADTASALIAKALQDMDKDRKFGPLKSLQGRIWEHGYAAGRLRGQVFPEVPACLRAWKEAGHSISIYSSGSVLAQQLLFRHSEAGDLGVYLAGYYDTAIGPKQESASYAAISHLTGGTGFFATDIVAEAQAAQQGGWQPVILRRPGNHPLPAHPFPEVADFRELENRFF